LRQLFLRWIALRWIASVVNCPAVNCLRRTCSAVNCLRWIALRWIASAVNCSAVNHPCGEFFAVNQDICVKFQYPIFSRCPKFCSCRGSWSGFWKKNWDYFQKIVWKLISISSKFLKILNLENCTHNNVKIQHNIYCIDIFGEYFVNLTLFTFIIYWIYWKYWFHTRNFEFFFLLKSCFSPIKSHKTWKKARKIKNPSVTCRRRRAAAVDRNLCHAYRLDHKT
jgi:hypothetical protein